MKIAELRRLNAENGGKFFAREHGSRYSRRTWIDAEGLAWIWYTFETFDGGVVFKCCAFGIDGRVLSISTYTGKKAYVEPVFSNAQNAEAWIKDRCT